MEIIRTTTGKTFPIRFCGSTVVGIQSILYIEFIGASIQSIVPIFSNPDETRFLEGILDNEVIERYASYTELKEAIVLASSGNLRIALFAPINDMINR